MLKEFLRSLPKSKKLSLNPRNVAASGPVERGYAFYALLSSDAGHPGLDALQRYTKPVAGGLQVALEPISDGEEIHETVNLACHAMLWVSDGIADWFNMEPDPDLASLIREMASRTRNEPRAAP